MSPVLAIVVFVVSLLAAIMLHEAGHFITARWFGMRADRFFLGFGPTLWSRRAGETEYGVKALPLGGFVRIRGMAGDEDERLAPVADEVFDPAAVAADRRAEAGAEAPGSDGLPEATWQRLRASCAARGADQQLVDRIVRRVRESVPAETDAAHAREVCLEVLVTEVGEPRRVGDLAHRLLEGDRGRHFSERPGWQRAIVLVAGSAMHFLIAAAVLFGGLALVPQWQGDVDPVVSEVVADSPADEAGLQPGDELVAVGDVRSSEYERLQQAIAARPEQATELTLLRDGEERTVEVTPERVTDEETGEPIGRVGFVPRPVQETLAPTDAAYEAVLGDSGVVAMTGATFDALGRVFGPEGLATIAQQVTGDAERDASSAVSVVGAAGLAGEAESYGGFLLVALIASINVFIGVFNLLPLPPLDGGHLAVLGIERAVNGVRGLMGRSRTFAVDPRAIAAVAMPVLLVLGFVFVSLLWLDVTQPVQLP